MDRTDPQVGEIFDRIRRARAAREAGEAEFREALIAAHRQRLNRYTVTDIANEAGVTRERIYQILRGE